MVTDAAPELPPPPPDRRRISRVLGPTAGPSDGNVRAILAIVCVVAIHSIFSVLLVGYMRGSATDLKDFLLAFGGALTAADIGIINYYFGRRSGETS